MSIKRIFDLLEHYNKNWTNNQQVLSGKDNGTWVHYNISDFIEKSNNVSYGLLSLGVQKGDKIENVKKKLKNYFSNF